jgi:hypothetical protein
MNMQNNQKGGSLGSLKRGFPNFQKEESFLKYASTAKVAETDSQTT